MKMKRPTVNFYLTSFFNATKIGFLRVKGATSFPPSPGTLQFQVAHATHLKTGCQEAFSSQNRFHSGTGNQTLPTE